MSDILWIAYLGILGAPAIGFLLKGKYKTTAMKVDFFVSCMTWTGLFGYVTSINVGPALLWKMVFFVGILWDLLFSSVASSCQNNINIDYDMKRVANSRL